MPGPEAAVVRRIVGWLKTVPGLEYEVRHGTAFGKAGQPDISCCYRGRRIEMEVKRPGGKPTPLQAARLAAWERAGAITGVAHSLDEAQEIVRRAGEGWRRILATGA